MTSPIVLNCFESPRLQRLSDEADCQMLEGPRDDQSVTVLTPREATAMLLRQRYAGWYRIES